MDHPHQAPLGGRVAGRGVPGRGRGRGGRGRGGRGTRAAKGRSQGESGAALGCRRRGELEGNVHN